MSYHLLWILCLVILSGCGGGGSAVQIETPTETPTDPQPQPEPQSRLPYPLASPLASGSLAGDGQLAYLAGSMERRQATFDDVKQMPITYAERFDELGRQLPLVYVGIDQGPGVYQENDQPETPSIIGEWRGYEARYGRLNDGAGKEKVIRYFLDLRIPRYYKTAPEVRLVGSPTATEIQKTIAAMQALNAGLPDSAKLTFGDPLPDLMQGTDGQLRIAHIRERALDNVIHIEFADYADHARERSDAWTFAPANNDDHSINFPYIFFLRDSPWRHSISPSTVLHELTHAVGMAGHIDTPSPDDGSYLPSVIGVARFQILTPVDREALRVLYDRVAPSDDPTEYTDFGPWTSESLHFHANGRFVGFGVTLRNGYAEPWAYGYLPVPQDQTDGPWAESEIFLADNPNLGGTVTWTGSLLGVSPLGNELDDTKRAFASVAGDASISVNLDTLTGQADFTNLEAWDPDPNAVAGEEWAYFATPFPGESGTGVTWGDGDLNYDIAVQNNVFRQTGGDDGILSGHFTGLDHEGAAGTLVRSDLTAAFGAER